MLIFSASVVLLAVLIAGLFVVRRTSELQHADLCMDHFYRSAKALADDDRTPQVILDMAGRMSKDLMDGSILRMFLFQLVRGRAKPDAKRMLEINQAVDVMPPELQGHFYRMCVTAVFSVSFQSFVLGPVFRRVAMYGANVAQRSREQERDVHAEKMATDIFWHDGQNGHHSIAA